MNRGPQAKELAGKHPVQLYVDRKVWLRVLARIRQDAERTGRLYGPGRLRGRTRLYQGDVLADLLRQYAEGVTWLGRTHHQEVKRWWRDIEAGRGEGVAKVASGCPEKPDRLAASTGSD